jgi:MOSC domain-containing protein YiiM
MTREDQIQQGKVVHVGLSSTKQQNSIKKTSNGSIDLAPGGVVGDYHFQYKLDHDLDKRLHLNQYPELDHLIKTQGGSVIQTQQISLYEVEEINRLRSLRSYLEILQPGWLGENITTQGIRLNEIRYGSIVVINDVRLKVQARRSFCRRIFEDLTTMSLPGPYSLVGKHINALGEMQIGIMCQVLDVGSVTVGNAITVFPNPDLVGQPWSNLSTPGEGHPTLDRVEYLPNE